MQDHTEQIYTPLPRIVARPSGKRIVPQCRNLPPIKENLPAPSREQTVPNKPVICFECGLISLVPKAAISARCHHCSAYIRMDDIFLHNRSLKTNVQTWGDVTVKPDSDLTHITIQCKNIALLGKISGKITCTGTCFIRKSHVFKGEIHAHTLEIDKRTDVTVANPVQIQQAFIRGTFRGNIICKGKVTICKNAKILGDVQASSLIFEEGGSHFGRFHTPQIS